MTEFHFDFAPMEGITGQVFRQVFHKHFGGIYAYYTPFITPKEKRGMDRKDRKELDLENNRGMRLIPQILTADGEAFLKTAEKIKELGYEEVNLNLGCPSGTVVGKGRGAGALSDTEKLRRFLYVIFEGAEQRGIKVSLKTRIGVEEAEEFPELLQVYKQFDFSRLIIHPRTRKEYYRGKIHEEAFRLAADSFVEETDKLSFNGDLFSPSDVKRTAELFPGLRHFMIGRGFLRNPFLILDLTGEVTTEDRKARLRAYTTELFEAYKEDIGEERVAMLKMKELWSYLHESFEGGEKFLKEIKKARQAAEYKAAVNVLFSNCSVR